MGSFANLMAHILQGAMIQVSANAQSTLDTGLLQSLRRFESWKPLFMLPHKIELSELN